MPTYQYRCQDCDVLHEVFQSFTDDALTICPSCDGALRKLYNSVGVVFKGTGFYRTDSRDSSSSSAPATSATESAKKAETKSETKTESKPAATPSA